MWLALPALAAAAEDVLTAASCGSTSAEAMLFEVALATTADGTPWAAAVHADITREPDHLGNAYRWKNGICLSRRGPDGWSAPVRVDDPELRVAPGGLRLVPAPDGELWVVYAGDHASPVADGAVPPGRYDVRLVRIGAGGASAPESLIQEHPRLLHGFDLAFAPDGTAHFVWSPWPGTSTDEHAYLRRREGAAWTAPERLPLFEARNTTQPQLTFDSGGPVVTGLVQTSAYTHLSVAAWRRGAAGWTVTPLDEALSFAVSGGGDTLAWQTPDGVQVYDSARQRPIREYATDGHPFAVDGPWTVLSSATQVAAARDAGDPIGIGSGEIVGHVAVDARSGLAAFGVGDRTRPDRLVVVSLPD